MPLIPIPRHTTNVYNNNYNVNLDNGSRVNAIGSENVTDNSSNDFNVITLESSEYYSYTAVLTKDDDGWLVEFPDLERCATNAETQEEAIIQAGNILEDYMAILERTNSSIPVPTPYDDVEIPSGGSKQRIVVSMRNARLRWGNETVRRTVTIPAWIDYEAQEEGLNLSHVLQSTLSRRLKRKKSIRDKVQKATV